MSLSDWANKDFRIPESDFEEMALTIVVRVEKGDEVPTDTAVKRSVAEGLIRFFDDERTAVGGQWHELLTRWMNGRIRKVTRRARGSEWDKVKQLDGFYYASAGVEIFIIPPHLNHEPPELVKKLQVSGLDLEKQEPVHMDINRHTLFISFNPSVSMTTGKSTAQVGHAVQLAILKNTVEVLEGWREEGFPVFFIGWESFHSLVNQVQFEPVIEVHDAGFTEVEANSLTVKAVLVG